MVQGSWFKAKELFLCVLSAALLILSFPKFNIALFAWFGFMPLFSVLKNKSRLKAFFLSYITGVFFWSGIIYWLIHVTLAGTIILILYLALYFGLFGLFFRNYQLPAVNYELRAMGYELLAIPSLWVLLEYIRSHLFTGFPWALLGYSQYLNLPAIQIADIFGAWGVSFLVMLVNVALYKAACCQLPAVDRKRIYLVPLLILVFSLAYGYFKTYSLEPTAYNTGLKVSIVQGNIAQELKWDPEAKNYILGRYASLTEQAAIDSPSLIVWPEASSPGLLGEDEESFRYLLGLSKKVKIPLLIGIVVRDKEEYFNSALLIHNAGIIGRYDKIHLVPFGEYIPLKKMLPFLATVVPIGDINRGEEYTVLEIPDSDKYRALRKPQIATRFAVLICFEDLFPELSREFIKKGAGFLVNITNDAWYKRTSAPFQHLQASVFRAVENRTFLVRAANTGVSGFIAPSGRIIHLVKDKNGNELFSQGFKTGEIKALKKPLTLYTRYGDIFLAACLLFLFYAIIMRFKNRQ